MMYRLCDMIYGLRRMIYLLRKYDIISVPFIREAYIICGADIIAEAISSVPQGTDIIVKNRFCQQTKAVFTWCRQPDSNRYAFYGEGF